MADSLLYEISKAEEMDGEPFIRRENVYIIDQNNGSYTNNQIIMDCAAVSNSGKWADFANAYLAVPLLVTLTSTFNFSAVPTDFALGLKNGFHQIVSSMNVEYNNTSVVQISNFSNLYMSYKLNTTLSVDDVVTIGSQIGFKQDSSQSWQYVSTASPSGIGSVNNYDEIVATQFDQVFAGAYSNNGYASRQLDITFTNNQLGVVDLLGAGTTWASVSAQFAKNYTVKATAGGVYAQAWNILATIRLKDMTDFFAQMPLTRNAYIKMYVNLNQSLTTFQIATATGNLLLPSSSSVVVYGGNTNPLMISSGVIKNGLTQLAAAVVAGGPTQTFTASVSVLTSLDGACPTAIARNPMLSGVRLYVNLYTMNYQKEEEYLAQRTKTIKYKDIFQYQFLNVSGSFNFLVSNGISGLKEIVICPFIAATTNGSATVKLSPIRSPFASEPATCSPLMWFNNFNIQISGVNIFTNNEQYGFEQFQNELYGVGSINGGLVDGMTSGLISQTAFYNNYGYLVADVARRLPEDSRTPKSVQISGTSLSQLPVDLYVFCVFEKSITIDLYSGKRLE